MFPYTDCKDLLLVNKGFYMAPPTSQWLSLKLRGIPEHRKKEGVEWGRKGFNIRGNLKLKFAKNYS